MVERTDQMVLIFKFKGCCDRVAPKTRVTRGENRMNLEVKQNEPFITCVAYDLPMYTGLEQICFQS